MIQGRPARVLTLTAVGSALIAAVLTWAGIRTHPSAAAGPAAPRPAALGPAALRAPQIDLGRVWGRAFANRDGRDTAFRIAGLENPTIQVKRGAIVQIRFVNSDSDSAHGWLLLDPVVQVGSTVHGPRAFPGAYAPILGDPTAAGQAMETISFRAATDGTYRYECPVPGHAAMGMQGTLEVIG